MLPLHSFWNLSLNQSSPFLDHRKYQGWACTCAAGNSATSGNLVKVLYCQDDGIAASLEVRYRKLLLEQPAALSRPNSYKTTPYHPLYLSVD